MKPALLLLTSSLVIAASGAFAQGTADACHNQYGSCVERCASRPQSVQAACSQSCEATTNQCYSGMYGPSPQGAQAPVQAAAPGSEAGDARNEATAATAAKPAKTSKKH